MQRLQHRLPGRSGSPTCSPARSTRARRRSGSAWPAAQQIQGRIEQPGAVAGPLGGLLLRLRLVHDRLPRRREDRRDEQPGPRPAARGQAARRSATGGSARPTSRARSGVAVLAARQLRLRQRARPGRDGGDGRHPPQGAAARSSRSGRSSRRWKRAGRPGAGADRPRCRARRGRRLLPRLRGELLRAARRRGRDRGPAPERLRRRSSRRRSAAACR